MSSTNPRLGGRGLLAFASLLIACGGAPAASDSGSSAGSGGAAGARSELAPAEIAQRSMPAIVRVEARSGQGSGVGTGFVIASEGRIATNLHVIGGSSEIEVVLLDGTRLPVPTIAAIDPERDLAVLLVTPPEALPVLNLGDSDVVLAGDPVVAIGNPLGVLDYTVSDGLISSVRRVSEELTVLQISAPISQGSSGGPLFNRYGEVIGIATFIAGSGQNLNFGIPSNYLRSLLGRDDGLTPAALNEELARRLDARPRPTGGGLSIRRQVPEHDLSLLDGCREESMVEAVEGITKAIQSGAPLYNQGNHEACYRIYEGAAIRLERELDCPGLRDALGQGLLRAGTLDDYTAKAWAMRDAFDGVLDVIERRAAADSARGSDDASEESPQESPE
ncbi:S1C family serine protease [Haliangium sp.]|uniref:S1C family serine protease n=1 Tax=Haliangium sp. TaxID=2663208 RepID=UPI003D1503BC